MSEWTVVRPSRRHRTARADSALAVASHAIPESKIAVDSLEPSRLHSHVATLRQSSWWVALSDAVRSVFPSESATKPGEIVCFGLGSVAGSANARWQLACAVLLRDLLEGHDAGRASGVESRLPLRVFDPVLSSEELQFLRATFGCEPITENESGARRAGGEDDNSATVFFMPHCPLSLYCNVLRANWGPALSRVVIVGNSFASYDERIVRVEQR